MADSLPRLNALKAALTLVASSVTVVIFGLLGPVDWLAVAAPNSLLGGYPEARLARRLNKGRLRAAVITLGLAVTIYLVWKGT